MAFPTLELRDEIPHHLIVRGSRLAGGQIKALRHVVLFQAQGPRGAGCHHSPDGDQRRAREKPTTIDP